MGIDFRPYWHRERSLTRVLNVETPVRHTVIQHQPQEHADLRPAQNGRLLNNNITNHISNERFILDVWMGPIVQHEPVNNSLTSLHLLVAPPHLRCEPQEYDIENRKIDNSSSLLLKPNHNNFLCDVDEENISAEENDYQDVHDDSLKTFKTRQIEAFEIPNWGTFENVNKNDNKSNANVQDIPKIKHQLFRGDTKRRCFNCYKTLTSQFNWRVAANRCSRTKDICTHCNKAYCKKCFFQHASESNLEQDGEPCNL